MCIRYYSRSILWVCGVEYEWITDSTRLRPCSTKEGCCSNTCFYLLSQWFNGLLQLAFLRANATAVQMNQVPAELTSLYAPFSRRPSRLWAFSSKQRWLLTECHTTWCSQKPPVQVVILRRYSIMLRQPWSTAHLFALLSRRFVRWGWRYIRWNWRAACCWLFAKQLGCIVGQYLQHFLQTVSTTQSSVSKHRCCCGIRCQLQHYRRLDRQRETVSAWNSATGSLPIWRMVSWMTSAAL